MATAGDRARRTERVAVRMTPEVKRVIERAAALSGQTTTDFLTASAHRAAQQVLDRQERMVLSARDRELFVAALLDPPAPGERLRAAAKRYRGATSVES